MRAGLFLVFPTFFAFLRTSPGLRKVVVPRIMNSWSDKSPWKVVVPRIMDSGSGPGSGAGDVDKINHFLDHFSGLKWSMLLSKMDHFPV